MNNEYLIWVVLLALVAVGALLLLVFAELPEIEPEEARAPSNPGARATWRAEAPASKPVVPTSAEVGSGRTPGAAASGGGASPGAAPGAELGAAPGAGLGAAPAKPSLGPASVQDFRAVGARRPDRPGTFRPPLPSRPPELSRPPESSDPRVPSRPPAASARSAPPPPAPEVPSQAANQHASTIQPSPAGPPAPLRGVVDPPGDHHRVPGPWSKDDAAPSGHAEPAEDPPQVD